MKWTKKKIIKNILTIFVIIITILSLLYLVLYFIYLINPDDYKSKIDTLLGSKKAVYLLKNIAIILFGGGVFSVSLKYIQFMRIFEKEFNRLINSKKFTSKINKAIDQITFSESFLNRQNNLNNLWKIVTTAKYKKEFPELYNKIHKNLENELFKDNSLTSYYKNFQVSYDIELINKEKKIINVSETSSFTIIRNNQEKFTWDFWISYLKDNKNVKLNKEKSKINGITMDEFTKCQEKMSEKRIKDELWINKRFLCDLNGKNEYHIERHYEYEMELEKDRILSFSSSKIIDDISIFINYSNDLNIIFDYSGHNKFYLHNLFSKRKIINQSFINRDVFLPGEMFKLFVLIK